MFCTRCGREAGTGLGDCHACGADMGRVAGLTAYTSAPECYDGFGTRAALVAGADRHGRPVRLVLIRPEHADWQLDRYASGSHPVARDGATLDSMARFDVWRLHAEPVRVTGIDWAAVDWEVDRDGLAVIAPPGTRDGLDPDLIELTRAEARARGLDVEVAGDLDIYVVRAGSAV